MSVKTWGRTETGNAFHSFGAVHAICRKNVFPAQHLVAKGEFRTQEQAERAVANPLGFTMCARCVKLEAAAADRLAASLEPATEAHDLGGIGTPQETTEGEEQVWGIGAVSPVIHRLKGIGGHSVCTRNAVTMESITWDRGQAEAKVASPIGQHNGYSLCVECVDLTDGATEVRPTQDDPIDAPAPAPAEPKTQTRTLVGLLDQENPVQALNDHYRGTVWNARPGAAVPFRLIKDVVISQIREVADTGIYLVQYSVRYNDGRPEVQSVRNLIQFINQHTIKEN